MIKAYDHLSHMIGSAIVHEERRWGSLYLSSGESNIVLLHRCGYLQVQVASLMQMLEEADIPDPSAGS